MALKLYEIRDRLDDLRLLANESVLALYSQLENGEITVDEWEEQMGMLLTDYTFASYMLGYDTDTMPEEFLPNVNQHLNDQLNFLGQFAGAIAIGLAGSAMSPMTGGNPSDFLKWNAWRGRALSYIGGLTAPFWQGLADSYNPGGTPPKSKFPWETPDIQQSLPLPAIPGDGSTLCGQWCKCEWDIQTLDEDAGDYDCYWIMDRDAEHCQTCTERATRWSPLKIRNWDIVAKDVVIATKEEEESLIKAIVMKKLKEKIAEKGGKGSGNWGHSGLAGVHGGSSPTKTKAFSVTDMDVSKIEQSRLTKFGRVDMPSLSTVKFYRGGEDSNWADLKTFTGFDEGSSIRYLIAPNGDIVASKNWVTTHTATFIAMALNNPEKYDDKVVDLAYDCLNNNSNGWGAVENPRMEKYFEDEGWVRVRIFSIGKPVLTIETEMPEGAKAIRLVKRLYDRGQLPSGIASVTINGSHFKLNEVLTGKYLWEFPEPGYGYSIKGGKGSGNWGHSGLAGVHGGSSPASRSLMPQKIKFQDLRGTVVGSARGDTILIDPEQYKSLPSDGARLHVITHELIHNWVDREITRDAMELDRASKTLLLKTIEKDDNVYFEFILGTNKPSEAVVETVLAYVTDAPNPFKDFKPDFIHDKPAWTPEFWENAMKWAQHALDVAGVTKEQIVNRARELKKELESQSTEYKGGEGSGNWGHSGLAGVWGGSSPTIATSNLDKLSRFVDVDSATRGRKKEIQQAIFKGLELVDRVHKADSRGRFPIKIINSSASASARIKRYASNNRTHSIEVNQQSTDMSVENPTDLIHEIGHYFTLTSDGKPRETPESMQKMDNLRKALEKTEYLKALNEMLLNPHKYKPFTNKYFKKLESIGRKAETWIGDSFVREHIRYLLDFEEVLARSYCQYIVTKTQYKTGMKALAKEAKIDPVYGANYRAEKTRTALTLPMQWTQEDFAPVMEAWDEYLRSVGWLNEQ